MNIEQAWQSVLGQLQMEMPRASFETWVQDTKPLSLQDGVMTVSVRNAYARDWLDNRLTSTISRLLVGILNTGDVSVAFVVNDGQVELHGESDAGQIWHSIIGQLQIEMPEASFDTWVRDTRALSLKDNILAVGIRNTFARDWLRKNVEEYINKLLSRIQGKRAFVNFVVNDGEDDGVTSENNDPEGDTLFSDASGERKHHNPEDSLDVALADYDSVYEQVVRPNRAVYLPGYFRRWLKCLGSDLGWLYVAYRQAAYIAGSRTGKATNRIPGEKIAALAGCAERTYWRRIENPVTWEKLKGLVEISDHGPEWDNKSSTPRRLPRRYTISMTLPLTPVDTNSLSKWLASHIEQCGGAEGALRAAVETPLDELIPLDASEAGEAFTVTKLVRELFGGGDLSNKLLDSLATAIQNRIMPQNDLIVVTEYFLKHVLPHIGTGPGWMLTLLRDMCYVNPKNGEIRKRVTVKGGYAEIAGWMGMSRPLTIYEWLRGKKNEIPVLRIYACEVPKEEKQLDFEFQPRIFDVLIEEIPQKFLEVALTNPDYATVSIAFTRMSEHDYANVSIGLTRLSVSDYATVSIAFTQLSEDVYATVRVLSSLALKPNSLNSTNTTALNTSGENDKAQKPKTVEELGAVNLPSAWVLDRLLTQNKVHPKTQKTVRGGSAKALVSWLLYAFSPEGRGIEKPMNYALARLAEDPQSGAGDQYDTLASVSPADLIDVAHQASRGYLTTALHKGELSELASLWMDVMGINDSAARKLMRYLVGDQSPNIQTKIRRLERWDVTENGTERTIEESIEEV